MAEGGYKEGRKTNSCLRHSSLIEMPEFRCLLAIVQLHRLFGYALPLVTRSHQAAGTIIAAVRADRPGEVHHAVAGAATPPQRRMAVWAHDEFRLDAALAMGADVFL